MNIHHLRHILQQTAFSVCKQECNNSLCLCLYGYPKKSVDYLIFWGCTVPHFQTDPYLVGGLKHVLFFHSVGNVIIPTDELTPSFFRGVGQPPTIYIYTIINHYEPLLTD